MSKGPVLGDVPRLMRAAILATTLVGALTLCALPATAARAQAITGGQAMRVSASSVPPPPHVPVPAQGTGELKGVAADLSDPTGMPPGVVNGPCKPSRAHPFPVVLVHGTFANENFTWQTLAPMLSDAGYCVFGLNYGATTWTEDSGNHVYGVDLVENSALQLDAFVKHVVLPDTMEPNGTHASKVDIVGHSQGGMMPRYMLEKTGEPPYPGLGDASLVHMLVGLAPSNHGANAYGLVPIFENLFGSSASTFPENSGCGACGEQEANSPFLAALDSEEAVPHVLYYVIESEFDEVVTPAPSPAATVLGEWPSAYLHGPSNQVLNLRLQDQCPTDTTEHIGIVYDPVALQDVVDALAHNSPVGASPLTLAEPACPLAVPPLVSG